MRTCPYLKKRWGKVLHIFEPTLRQNYYFIYAKDRNEYLKIVKKRFNIQLPIKDAVGAFNVIAQGDTDVCLLWANIKDVCNIAHECFHAIIYSLQQRDIELSSKTEEIYAYHLAFLMRAIIEK